MDDIRALLEDVARDVDDAQAPPDLLLRGRRRARRQVLGVATAVLLIGVGTLPLVLGQGRSELIPAGPDRATAAPSASPTSLPAAIAAACGRPGSSAEVPAVRLTIRHAECDLTAVSLTHGVTGVVVPPPGTTTTGIADGISSSGSLSVTRDARTKDVTFDARGAENQVKVSGVLVMTGGPPGAAETPVEGSIAFDSKDGSSGGTGTAPDGSFTLELLPGIYVIIGRSPSYNSGRSDCRLDLVVHEQPITGVHVSCPRK